jgi:hypothetical protein
MALSHSVDSVAPSFTRYWKASKARRCGLAVEASGMVPSTLAHVSAYIPAELHALPRLSLSAPAGRAAWETDTAARRVRSRRGVSEWRSCRLARLELQPV